MCVAIVKQPGMRGPSYRMIEHLWAKNPHGGGFCVIRPTVTDGIISPYATPLVHGNKGYMDKYEFIDEYQREVKLDDAAFIHMRVSTHGGVHPGGTHPFPASSDVEALNATEWQSRFGIMHNGTIAGFGMKDDGELSDTQEFIQQMLSDRILLYSLFSQRNTVLNKVLTDKLGKSRIAIMRFDGEIITIGEWHQAGECLYSKKDFLGISPKSTKKLLRRLMFKSAEMEAIKKEAKKAPKKTKAKKSNKNVTQTTTEAALKKDVLQQDANFLSIKSVNDPLVDVHFDKFLNRNIPFHATLGVRLDHLIKCPACGRFDGEACLYNKEECCTSCIDEDYMAGKIDPEKVELSKKEDLHIAKDLARPLRKGTKIRKHLTKEYGLEYCLELNSFIPGDLCLECCNVYNNETRGKACWIAAAMLRDDPKEYEARMQSSINHVCHLEAETLEDVGGEHLILDFNRNTMDAPFESEKE